MRPGSSEVLLLLTPTRLDEAAELRWFQSCLRWMCMDHQSAGWHAAVSWLLFATWALAVPAFSYFVLSFNPDRRPYNAVVQIALSAASAISFACLSAVIRRVGLRRFLFLHKLRHESDRVHAGYTAQLNRSFRLLACFVLPCFAAETTYKVWWYCTGAGRIPFLGNAVLSDVVACAMELVSWVYRTAIFLLTCVLFRLICYLQRLRLHDFAAVHFAEHAEAEAVLQEHLDIRRQLKIISHRFRGFVVACLLTVTASQFASVLLITRKQSQDDLFNTNTGELALCSIVLVTGLLTCLCSAAKITHHAQALTSHAAMWHACCTTDSFEEVEPNGSFIQVISTANPSSVHPECIVNEDDESPEDTDDDDDDKDLLEDAKLTHPHAHTISFQKRQALVTYLENNKAGITVYGYTMDRTWLNAIFMVEWTLFLWLLGKTIGIS